MDWNSEAVTVTYPEVVEPWPNTTNSSSPVTPNLQGATISSPIIMFLSGVIGNLLALLVLHRTRLESQRLMFHSLVAGLVWNDLIGIVLTSPVTIASYINGLQMPGGEHLCRFNGFIMICFGLSTPLIVSAMAIERFLFVRYTFFYTKHCAPGAARLVMLVIWGFVLFFGLLPMFGFGNYIIQYPRTWCFLDFRTTNPVDAAYGYMYSTLNLLLVLVMMVCNLVVVVTLARVRDYRRKYSNGSMNSVLTNEGILDDSQRQQALVRRRKQKDIELQMIVVMCTMTTIFMVCWVPLMVHISLTLATRGSTPHLFGLIAIRLASLNQTLNPWMYVILRRTLIIRVKKFFCRWKKYFRSRSHLSPTPVHRKHQYVHVRNQLCHRNIFVGAEIKNDSLTDSVRKSLQQAIPAAMSLPDVMMVNTGRRDLDMPLPDVAKAESYAGRVSHSDSASNLFSCAYCNLPANAGCVECLTARYTAVRRMSRSTDAVQIKGHNGVEDNASPDSSGPEPRGITMNKDHVVYNKRFNMNREGAQHSAEVSCPSKEALFCSKHSSHSQHLLQQLPPQPTTSSGEAKFRHSQKKKEIDPISMTTSSFRGHSLRDWSRDSRFSQHMHKTRNNSKSSSSKGQLVSRQSGSGEEPGHAQSPTEKHPVLNENPRSEAQPDQGYLDQAVNESLGWDEDDEVFNEGTDVTGLETRKDATTTEDNGFSSMLTDSIYLSDTTTPSPAPQVFGSKLLPLKPTLDHHPNRSDEVTNLKPLNTEVHVTLRDTKLNPPKPTSNGVRKPEEGPTNSLQLPTTKLPKFTVAKSKPAIPAGYNNKSYNMNASDSSSCLIPEDSDQDSDRSSGIFSAESPAKTNKEVSLLPKFEVKQESQSEPFHGVNQAKKPAARRVKSYN